MKSKFLTVLSAVLVLGLVVSALVIEDPGIGW